MANRNIAMNGVNIGRGRFRNFRGEKNDCNTNGDRKFTLLLNENIADRLKERGWNVKMWVPKNDDPTRVPEPPVPILDVAVDFSKPDMFPVTIEMKTGDDVVELDEDTVGILDTADILNADIVLRPHYWNMNGRTGIKAYLKKLTVTLEEDEQW